MRRKPALQSSAVVLLSALVTTRPLCILRIPSKARLGNWLVPEVRHNSAQLMEHFGDEFRVSNVAAGTMAQACIWTYFHTMVSVAPSGGWVSLPWETVVDLPWGWMYVYMYGETSSVRKIAHGLQGNVSVGIAAERMMNLERECMQNLAKAGWRGRAIAVWPPVMINGSPVS